MNADMRNNSLRRTREGLVREDQALTRLPTRKVPERSLTIFSRLKRSPSGLSLTIISNMRKPSDQMWAGTLAVAFQPVLENLAIYAQIPESTAQSAPVAPPVNLR